MKWGEVASIILVFFGLVAMGYVGYSYGYNSGMQKGYDLGFSDGYVVGNSSGFESGFVRGSLQGYGLGNESGYSMGYLQGYATGNLTGYQLGYELGYNEGYQKGVVDGAGTGYTLRDPTFLEVLSFLTSDKTDRNPYTSSYTCINFAADVKNNAFATGYKCGFVYIKFKDSAHAVVCFNTTNRGLIFVEPQYDDIVTLKIGESYAAQNGYVIPSYDDKIVSYVIVW
ncbi:MAG: hypothetical protein QXP73_02845 [Candidatus Methanomethylicaceae archaeon]|nr:hypothetical protein [Candidatus Verstraetearchaeota archaeon]